MVIVNASNSLKLVFHFIIWVTRSKKDRIWWGYPETRNVFTNLRFSGKRKYCTKQLTSILKLWHSHNYNYKLVVYKLVTFGKLNSRPFFISPPPVTNRIFLLAQLQTFTAYFSVFVRHMFVRHLPNFFCCFRW